MKLDTILETEYTELSKIESDASEARFFLHLLKEYDRDIRWHMIVGNDRPEVLEKMLFDKNTLPGFNDSGAHLINLAFFDGNLLTLQIAQKDSLEKVALAVRRLLCAAPRRREAGNPGKAHAHRKRAQKCKEHHHHVGANDFVQWQYKVGGLEMVSA